MVNGRYTRAVIQGLMVAGLVLADVTGSAHAEVTLFDNLGTLHHEITTTSERAQKFFDQGLRLSYAFNHEEAIAAFTEAFRLDPDAPMPYWGVALSLGPNINAAMDTKAESRAVEAIQKASARLERATPRERAYVEALAVRYSIKKSLSRKAKDEAYVKAVRRLAHDYPDDVDAATLSAEAMMVLHPWDYWRADGRPQPGTEEIVATLEAALRQHPDHPGACHYYIHAVEASPDPKRGLDCAKRLPSLMPGAGHLVHMPAHIYMRVGLYREASERNATAATVDREYLLHHPLEGNYASGYYAHNLHFLNASLVMEGRSVEAMQVARDLLSKISVEEIVKEPSLEWYAPTLLLTMARFGQWGELIRQPPPPKELRFTTGLWHYVRGLAFVATTRFGSAEGELSNLRKSLKALVRVKTEEAKISRTLLKIAERVLAGEMAARRGEFEAGIQAAREALQLETTLPYSEPPFWFQPVRHNLGAILLLAGRAGEAESVYREDLRLNPENGWALQGLVLSLQAQHKDAAQEQTRLQAAWAQADVTLTGSRF
jgi:tetratricopeptide (TPR) repeat protein